MSNSIATKSFRSPINSETSFGATPLSEDTESTLELFDHEDGSYGIEWDVPELEITEYIGIWCEEGTKEICDYDGVFEVPKEAIEMLKEQGFDCSYLEG
jgi:hypothetical protein